MFVIVDTATQKARRITNRDEAEAGVLPPGMEQHPLPPGAPTPADGPVEWDPIGQTLVVRDVSTKYLVVDAGGAPLYVTDEDHAAEGKLPAGAEQRVLPADAPTNVPRKISADGTTLVVDQLAVWQQEADRLQQKLLDLHRERRPLVDAVAADPALPFAPAIADYDTQIAAIADTYKTVLGAKPA